ncbi:MAG: hypothetical protein HY543_05725 [Deltaproteobacteria bacterium]|nr:hypothetical protein [Deltaproteobacteria bacterium]
MTLPLSIARLRILRTLGQCERLLAGSGPSREVATAFRRAVSAAAGHPALEGMLRVAEVTLFGTDGAPRAVLAAEAKVPTFVAALRHSLRLFGDDLPVRLRRTYYTRGMSCQEVFDEWRRHLAAHMNAPDFCPQEAVYLAYDPESGRCCGKDPLWFVRSEGVIAHQLFTFEVHGEVVRVRTDRSQISPVHGANGRHVGYRTIARIPEFEWFPIPRDVIALFVNLDGLTLRELQGGEDVDAEILDRMRADIREAVLEGWNADHAVLGIPPRHCHVLRLDRTTGRVHPWCGYPPESDQSSCVHVRVNIDQTTVRIEADGVAHVAAFAAAPTELVPRRRAMVRAFLECFPFPLFPPSDDRLAIRSHQREMIRRMGQVLHRDASLVLSPVTLVDLNRTFIGELFLDEKGRIIGAHLWRGSVHSLPHAAYWGGTSATTVGAILALSADRRWMLAWIDPDDRMALTHAQRRALDAGWEVDAEQRAQWQQADPYALDLLLRQEWGPFVRDLEEVIRRGVFGEHSPPLQSIEISRLAVVVRTPQGVRIYDEDRPHDLTFPSPAVHLWPPSALSPDDPMSRAVVPEPFAPQQLVPGFPTIDTPAVREAVGTIEFRYGLDVSDSDRLRVARMAWRIAIDDASLRGEIERILAYARRRLK